MLDCYECIHNLPNNIICIIFRPLVLQEHVQGFRQPAELANLLPVEEIMDLDRVTNRYYRHYQIKLQFLNA